MLFWQRSNCSQKSNSLFIKGGSGTTIGFGPMSGEGEPTCTSMLLVCGMTVIFNEDSLGVQWTTRTIRSVVSVQLSGGKSGLRCTVRLLAAGFHFDCCNSRPCILDLRGALLHDWPANICWYFPETNKISLSLPSAAWMFLCQVISHFTPAGSCCS